MNRGNANQFLTGCQHEQAVRVVTELVIQGASSEVIQQALTGGKLTGVSRWGKQ